MIYKLDGLVLNCIGTLRGMYVVCSMNLMICHRARIVLNQQTNVQTLYVVCSMNLMICHRARIVLNQQTNVQTNIYLHAVKNMIE